MENKVETVFKSMFETEIQLINQVMLNKNSEKTFLYKNDRWKI